MEPINFPKPSTDKLLSVLLKHYSQCSIYVFGYRGNETGHFYILLLTAETIPYTGSDFANWIFEQSGKTISATVLVHTLNDLATKQPGQQLFFDTVLRYGKRLHIDKAHPPYLLNLPNESEVKNAETYWLKCVAVAQFNIGCAKESTQVDVELCKVALLHTACLQIALGLIRVFMGYAPNEFGLRHLLQLCGHFTDMPLQLFDDGLPENKRRYKMLCAPPSMLNHWLELHADEANFLWLLHACEQFVTLSEALVAEKLFSNPINQEL